MKNNIQNNRIIPVSREDKINQILRLQQSLEQFDIRNSAQELIRIRVEDLNPHRDLFKTFILSTMSMHILNRPLTRKEMLFALDKPDTSFSRLMNKSPLRYLMISENNVITNLNKDNRYTYWKPQKLSECSELDDTTRRKFKIIEDKILNIIFSPIEMKIFFEELGKNLKNEKIQARILDCLQWVTQVLIDSYRCIMKLIENNITEYQGEIVNSYNKLETLRKSLSTFYFLFNDGKDSKPGKILLQTCAFCWSIQKAAEVDPEIRYSYNEIKNCILNPLNDNIQYKKSRMKKRKKNRRGDN